MAAEALSGHRYWYARRINVGGVLIAPVSEHYHGKPGTYDYYGCRCDLCKRAKNGRTVPTPRRTPTRPRRAPQVRHRQAEPEPAPPPEPEQPAPEPAPPDPEPVRPTRPVEEIPSMSHTAVDAIHDHERLNAVLAAYYRPEIQMPAGQPGYDRRLAGDVSIVVANGVVVSVDERERATGAPETLAPTCQPKRRKRGPAGNRTPTTWGEVISRAEDAGCVMDHDARHIKVTLPSGEVMTLPKSASDHRAIRNAVRELAQKGVDVYRSLK